EKPEVGKLTRPGIAVVARLGEIALVEGIAVQNQQPPGLHFPQVHLQCGWIHGDQYIDLVASGADLPGAEVDLVGADAKGRADRRAYLGGKVREGRQVVSRQGRGERELA